MTKRGKNIKRSAFNQRHYQRKISFYLLVGLISLVLAIISKTALATDFSSTNFIIRDPITGGAGGGYGTSSNFRLWSSFSQPSIGLSTSTNRELRAGFLYFAEPTPPPAGPPPAGPPPAGGGSGSVTTPIPPGPTPPGVLPPIGPLIPPFISFITGERIPPGCVGVSRSDLNCDGEVGLQDLSILFSRPRVITGRTLSLLFFDWTRGLPVPARGEAITGIAREGVPQIRPAPPLAQVVTAVAPTTTPEIREPRESLVTKTATSIAKFFIKVGNFFAKLFGL